MKHCVFLPVIPKLAQCQGAASLWQQCVAPGSVYSVSAQSFMATVSSLHSSTVAETEGDIAAETGTFTQIRYNKSIFTCHLSLFKVYVVYR